MVAGNTDASPERRSTLGMWTHELTWDDLKERKRQKKEEKKKAKKEAAAIKKEAAAAKKEAAAEKTAAKKEAAAIKKEEARQLKEEKKKKKNNFSNITPAVAMTDGTSDNNDGIVSLEGLHNHTVVDSPLNGIVNNASVTSPTESVLSPNSEWKSAKIKMTAVNALSSPSPKSEVSSSGVSKWKTAEMKITAVNALSPKSKSGVKRNHLVEKQPSFDPSSSSHNANSGTGENDYSVRKPLKETVRIITKEYLKNHQAYKPTALQEHVKDKYPEIHKTSERVCKYFFLAVFLLGFVFFVIQAAIKDLDVSKKELAWYGHHDLPDVAVRLHNSHGSAKQVKIRAYHCLIPDGKEPKKVMKKLELGKCKIKIHGQIKVDALCLPKQLQIGETFGMTKYEYVQISVEARRPSIPNGNLSFYKKDYKDLQNDEYIWNENFYNFNQGYFKTNIEMYYKLIRLVDLRSDWSSVFSMFLTDDQMAEKYMKYDYEHLRVLPFLEAQRSPALNIYLRSSLMEVEEIYNVVGMVDILQQSGGFLISVHIIFGIMFTIVLCLIHLGAADCLPCIHTDVNTSQPSSPDSTKLSMKEKLKQSKFLLDPTSQPELPPLPFLEWNGKEYRIATQESIIAFAESKGYDIKPNYDSPYFKQSNDECIIDMETNLQNDSSGEININLSPQSIGDGNGYNHRTNPLLKLDLSKIQGCKDDSPNSKLRRGMSVSSLISTPPDDDKKNDHPHIDEEELERELSPPPGFMTRKNKNPSRLPSPCMTDRSIRVDENGGGTFRAPVKQGGNESITAIVAEGVEAIAAGAENIVHQGVEAVAAVPELVTELQGRLSSLIQGQEPLVAETDEAKGESKGPEPEVIPAPRPKRKVKKDP